MNGPDPKPSDRTRLLRAAADDALTASERAELQSHLAKHPDDAAVIDFERRLRAEVGRTHLGVEPSRELEGRIRGLAHDARPRRLRTIVSLAAAALILVAAILGVRRALRTDPDDFGFDGRGELVEFLGTHPRNCPITIERTIAEFEVRRFDEALTELGELLGHAPQLDDLTREGLEFRGMGRCGLPGHELSLHVMFTGAKGSPLEGAMLSLYVQRDDGRLPISEGSTYRLVPKASDLADVQMFAWRREGLDYFIVTPNVDAGRIALASAGAPPVNALL